MVNNIKQTKELLNKLKRNLASEFCVTLQDYLEARIRELDKLWAGDGSVDSFRQLQGRKLEVESMLKQLTSKPIKVRELDSYGS